MKYYYEPPVYDDLTSQQKRATTEVGALTLAGGPGTGKSVVSANRHISNYRDGRRTSVLLTYTKSLRYYLSAIVNDAAQKEPDNNKKKKILDAVNNVGLANSWSGNMYDEIIIDECQDLPENELVTLIDPEDSRRKILRQINMFSPPLVKDELTYTENGIDYKVNRWDRGYINYLKKFSQLNIVSYGADDKQIVYPERSTTQARLKQMFPGNKEHTLFQNFRNSYNVLMFCRSVLNYNIAQTTLDRLKQDNKIGTLPVLKIANSSATQDEAILDIIKEHTDVTHNIGILVPFIKNTPKSTSSVDYFHNLLTKNQIGHSKYGSDMDTFEGLQNIHVTTFKSSKGLEFHTVIIPNFNEYQSQLSHLTLVNEEDYYVAFTRTKTNLYLISSHDLPNINGAVLKRENFTSNKQKAAQIPASRNTNTNDDLPF